MNIQYYWGMDKLTPTQWISKCAERLGERWRTVPSADLEEVAIEIWRDAALRQLEPKAAAARWLLPVADH